jgi:hypothetical protein
MNTVFTPVCQWSRCSKPATEHVCYGLRAFGPDGRAVDAGSLTYTLEHSDLCELHSIRIADTYVHATVLGLDECPDRSTQETSDNVRWKMKMCSGPI